jgi:uncharacterized protein
VKEATVALDPALLEILRCPDDHHGMLGYDDDAQVLTCQECGRGFPVRDGIPVLLLDDAVPVTPAGRPDCAAGTAAGTRAAGEATAE